MFTHIRPEYQGKSGMAGNDYADGMWEHDQDVGKLLKKLDDMGISDNTIVVYTTDNGPNQFSWPDAATTPFRSEKDSNWEGAFRVPAMIRWPGKIAPGQIKRGIVSGMDWLRSQHHRATSAHFCAIAEAESRSSGCFVVIAWDLLNR